MAHPRRQHPSRPRQQAEIPNFLKNSPDGPKAATLGRDQGLADPGGELPEELAGGQPGPAELAGA